MLLFFFLEAEKLPNKTDSIKNRILKYFRSGKIEYGLYYTINRTIRAIRAIANYYIHCKSFYRCGHNVKIGNRIFIMYPYNIEIGNNVILGDNCEITTEIDDAKLFIDEGVQITGKNKIDYSGGIIIGKNTLISPGVKIITHDHGRDPRSRPKGKKLVIEENVWVGMDSIIMPGVGRIGSNSIVGAATIVTKSIPKDSVVYGCRGRVRKQREKAQKGCMK